jgi:hypothetical protein
MLTISPRANHSGMYLCACAGALPLPDALVDLLTQIIRYFTHDCWLIKTREVGYVRELDIVVYMYAGG